LTGPHALEKIRQMNIGEERRRRLYPAAFDAEFPAFFIRIYLFRFHARCLAITRVLSPDRSARKTGPGPIDENLILPSA